MDVRLAISLFGEPRFSFDGEPWRFAAPPRTLPLLSYLVLHAGERVSRTRLASLFWPDELDDDARSNLRRHMHHAARALPVVEGYGWFVADKNTVGWNPDAPASIDVAEFERALGEPSTLPLAVDLYRGDLIEPFYDDWILAERGRLQSLALGALYELSGRARRRREYPEAIARAERMLAIDAWREDAVRALMSARYEAGDRSSALAIYERFAQRLHAEMRVDPMPETIALRNAVSAALPLADFDEKAPEAERTSDSQRSFTTPFVGREHSIDTLRAAWMRAARRSGTTFFVTGEPGIGKSRLAAELSSIVDDQGGRTLLGLTSSPEAMPYQSLVDALRRGLPYLTRPSLDPLNLSIVAPLVPELFALHPGLAAAEPIEPERARTRLHEAFARIFEYIARARPLLLVLEDLHWAQSDTIDALGVLARRAGATSTLIVATYRDDSVTTEHPLREALRALQRERRAASLPLARLSAHDIEKLVRETSDTRGAPASLAAAAHRVSEGNALFVSQLLREYVETGAIPDESRGVRGVEDAILARMERLTPQVRAVADVAATVGREFSAEVVGEVGGWSQDTVLDAMGALMDRRLVRETGAPGLEYGFSHALIANALYDRTEPAVRSGRHRRIAQCLERLGDAALSATAARHWKEAGERERAASAYARAAERALRVYARADAVECAREAAALTNHARRRFDALRMAATAAARYGDVEAWHRDVSELERVAAQFGDEERFVALEARERYLAATGRRDEQRSTIEAMQTLAERARSASWRAKASDALGNLELVLGRARDAVAPLRTAFAIVCETDDRKLRSRIHQHLIHALIRVGDAESARCELGAMRAFSATGSDVDEHVDLLWAESAVALGMEDPVVLHRVGTDMLAMGRRLGDEELIARGHWRLGWAAFVEHDHAASRTHYSKAAFHFERLSQPHPLSTSLLNLGMTELEIGNAAEALVIFDRAAVMAERCGALNVAAYALANGADAHLQLGDFKTANENAFRAHQIGLETGELRLRATAASVLGVVECASGNAATGLAHVRDGVALWRTSASNDSLVDALCVLIEHLHEAGAHDEMGEYAAELALLVRDLPNQRRPGRAAFALALVERTAGNAPHANVLAHRAREQLEAHLERYSDQATKAAYCAMPFNRAILEST